MLAQSSPQPHGKRSPSHPVSLPQDLMHQALGEVQRCSLLGEQELAKVSWAIAKVSSQAGSGGLRRNETKVLSLWLTPAAPPRDGGTPLLHQLSCMPAAPEPLQRYRPLLVPCSCSSSEIFIAKE